MDIYNVGPDELNDDSYDGLASLNKDKYEWLVYYYENGGYDGSGTAVALRKDGQLVSVSLGHCPCYGPEIDSLDGANPISVEEVMTTPENIFDDDFTPVRSKVKELLGM